MQLILHIGQHKTGSKALQNALYTNTAGLHPAGYDYPLEAPAGMALRAWERNHHALFTLARACADAPATETKDAQRALTRSLTNLLLLVPSSIKTLILSSEDLFDMHTAHELAFEPRRVPLGARALAQASRALGLETRIVCYLRRQDHALAARYAQFIKGSQQHTAQFARYAAGNTLRLDYDWLVRCWEEAFSQEALMLRPLEPGPPLGGVVEDFFTHVLGLTPPFAAPGRHADIEVINLSPSRRQIMFMRALNVRSQRTQAVLARDRVLSAAFKEPPEQPRGAQAWLSGGARAQLLARHAAGNARLASRHFTGAALFREPPPAPLSRPPAPESLSLKTLLVLERSARAVAPPLRSQGVIVWLTSGNGCGRDQALAADLFAGLIGDPHHASIEWTGETREPVQWSRVRLFVAVGLAGCGHLDWQIRARLMVHRIPLLVCIAEVTPASTLSPGLRGVLRHAAQVLCATDQTRDQLQEILPATAKEAHKRFTAYPATRATLLPAMLQARSPVYT